jgi:hypothetical protein
LSKDRLGLPSRFPSQAHCGAGLLHPKLQYIFRTLEFQFKGIVKDCYDNHMYNWIENMVVNLIEAEDFPADMLAIIIRGDMHM